MSHYPGSERERRVGHASLLGGMASVFRACGMQAGDAELLAATLAEADLRGVHSHGSMRVPDYVKRLTEGGVDPRGRPRVVRDSGAALVVDGGNSMGQIGAAFAMDKAIERARETGIACAAVGGSNHCGAMAWYAMQALPHGMIGVATTNALPTMAPWGGADRIVGINPLAVAMPTATPPDFVLDTAFSGSAMGKIVVYRQKGEPIPGDWAFDAEGRPTTDPAAAIAGLLRPIGGFKGVGLAMATGVLSTLLCGAGYGTRLGSLGDGAHAGRDGHFVMAMNIAAFTDVGDFERELDEIHAEIRACRRAPGTERVYTPGEIEHELRARYLGEGIPLNDETLAGIVGTARSLGADAGELEKIIAGKAR